MLLLIIKFKKLSKIILIDQYIRYRGKEMDLLTLFSSNIKIISISRVDKHHSDKLTHFGVRKVEDYELDYIIDGEGFIVTDGVKYAAQKGCLFFRYPGMYVDGYLPYTCYLIRFAVEDTPSLSKSSPSNFLLPIYMQLINSQSMDQLFYNLYHEYIFENEFSVYLRSIYLNNIFHAIYTQLKQQATNSTCSNPAIENTIYYIEKYYYKNLSLDLLADISGYSKYTFCRNFKKVTGYTPATYISQYRINHAKKLLLETDLPIKEILSKCGFNNETHFYSVFKNSVKVTPNEYRQLNNIWGTLS